MSLFSFAKAQKGFTLAELLIALAILGVIATFTIPKVLTASTNSQNSSIAKEVAGMISGAHSNYQVASSIVDATAAQDFTASMNYVRTTNVNMTSGINCSAATVTCLMLHSGAVLAYGQTQAFGVNNYMVFNLDPDATTTANAPGSFVLYKNGRLTTGGYATGTVGANGIALITLDPSYLTW